MKTRQKRISASEFKAKCLKILDELGAEGIVIEKRGKPIAKVIPVGPADNSKLIGSMRGMIKVKGNTFSTGIKWDAQS
jgi:antitoxin (DNA-binding transcriptional repressor) of toxin-antitoxin stability system